VHFQVVSGQAPICDAAVQVWIAPGAPHWFTRSDAAGHFEVKLPRGTKEVGLTVAAQGYALKLTRVQISHDDDGAPRSNTIALDTSGGSVALDLQPSGHLADSSAIPYLVHKGAIEAVGTLIELSAHPPTANHGARIIETIEPGDYSLCLVSDPAELAALWVGASPPQHCRTGSVQQGETVTLSTPLPN
jgi:hypothetical protein